MSSQQQAPAQQRPRLSRATTASVLDLRPRSVTIAPLSPNISYQPRPAPTHRKTVSTTGEFFSPLAGVGSSSPSIPQGQWSSNPASNTTTPPISPRDNMSAGTPSPARHGPTPLATPPHSLSPPQMQPLPMQMSPATAVPSGPPRSGPLHPTKFPQYYAVSCFLPNISPDWITIAQRKGNSLLIVADNYESDGHYEWNVAFGADACMDTLRAKFNNETLEITVSRAPQAAPPTSWS